MKNLNGKVAWITGASSGIGEALAYTLAAEGCLLVLSARRKEALEAVKARCKLPDEQVLVLPLDLADHDNDFSGHAQIVAATFGRLDLLVNNGGISQRSYFNDTSLEVYRQLMEVNYFGTIKLTKAAMPLLQAQPESMVVVVTSVTGRYGTPLRTGYAASKHALHGFFDALRAEYWQKKVDILLVAPGYVRTQLSYHALLGDGTPQDKLDPGQAQGIAPENCARQILRGIKNKKREIYPGGFKEVLGIYLKRFFPGILAKVVRKVNVR